MLTCTNAVSIMEVLPCLGTSEEAVKHVTHHGTHLHLTLTTSNTVCDPVHYIVHTPLYTGLIPRPLYCTYTTLHCPCSQATILYIHYSTLPLFPGHYIVHTLLYTDLVLCALYCTYTTLHWPHSQATILYIATLLYTSLVPRPTQLSVACTTVKRFFVHTWGEPGNEANPTLFCTQKPRFL